MDFTDTMENQMDKLREAAGQTLNQNFTDEVLLTRALQHYRIIFLHIANKVMTAPLHERKIVLAKAIELELNRMNAIKLEME